MISHVIAVTAPSITDTQIDRLAELAQLSIDPQQRLPLLEKLNNVIQMVEAVTAIATDNVEPMAHPLDAALQLRADIVTETDQRQVMLALAPHARDGFYLVPKIIEG